METRFLVDTMCGRLARWLRILGYDSEWLDAAERKKLVVRALRESRTLLTRDRRFEKTRGLRTLLLRSDRTEDQVGQVLRELGLEPDPDRFFTRCTFCNRPLEGVPKPEVRSEVPPFVFETQPRFFRCPACRRIYWGGTQPDLFRTHFSERVKT